MARFSAWTVIFVAGGLALPATLQAASESDCQAEWRAADRNGDGFLEGVEAGRYLAYLRLGRDPLPEDGRLTRASFLAACRADRLGVGSAEASAPALAAAGLTAEQARDRAQAAGYSSVSSLVRDGDGVWRASAMKDGKATRIVVGHDGRVVPAAD